MFSSPLTALTVASTVLLASSCSTTPAPRYSWSEAPRPRPELAAPPLALADPAVVTFARQDPPAPQPAASVYASGFALAVWGARHSVGGDFDGQTVVVSPSDLTALPNLDAGLGFGASFGMKGPSGSFDMYLEQTEHDGDFGGVSLDTSMLNIGLRGRLVPGRFASPTQRWQPYFLAGVALTLMTVEDGSSDGMSVGDGDFTGFSCELGIGGLVNLSEHFALRLDLGYRWTELTSVDSLAFSGTIEDGVDADGMWTALGLVVTF